MLNLSDPPQHADNRGSILLGTRGYHFIISLSSYYKYTIHFHFAYLFQSIDYRSKSVKTPKNLPRIQQTDIDINLLLIFIYIHSYLQQLTIYQIKQITSYGFCYVVAFIYGYMYSDGRRYLVHSCKPLTCYGTILYNDFDLVWKRHFLPHMSTDIFLYKYDDLNTISIQIHILKHY